MKEMGMEMNLNRDPVACCIPTVLRSDHKIVLCFRKVPGFLKILEYSNLVYISSFDTYEDV